MTLETLSTRWDLIIVGGGITGAGILREAVRMQLKTLLVEQNDFAWGTSSRSSKLIHGGLRYLKEGHLRLTRDAVRQREYLLKAAPGLVEPLSFLVPVYKDRRPGRWTLEAGLSLYDLLAHKRRHRFFEPQAFLELLPEIDPQGLAGGFRFFDAQVDDARLVLRLINEAGRSGGHALNYTRATAVRRDNRRRVIGLTVTDIETGVSRDLDTPLVINATGVWAQRLHVPPKDRRLRPLRGSHLLFPSQTLPIPEAVSFMHPVDQRPVFAIPWQGAVLVGTTDLDHHQDLDIEPSASSAEVLYLMQGLKALFPSREILLRDCLATLAGVRPVLAAGHTAPSEASREHAVWKDDGLITVTGGKLTTFRLLAREALEAAHPYLPPVRLPADDDPLFAPLPPTPSDHRGLTPDCWRTLFGRYGPAALELVAQARSKDLRPIPGTHTLWAELPYVARTEHVRHLTDLLLRRVRIGLLTPTGGKAYLDRVQKLCRPVLPWDRRRWRNETAAYLERWRQAHGLADDLRPLPRMGASLTTALEHLYRFLKGRLFFKR